MLFSRDRHDSQSTQRKHNYQGNLLSGRDIDDYQGRDGNEENDKVGGDVHASVGEPQSGLAQTETGNRVIPELGNGDTVQESTNHSPSAINTQDRNHHPADNTHAVGGEYTEVLQKNRGFGAEDGGVVEWNCEPKCLVRKLINLQFKSTGFCVIPSSVFRGSPAECL